jgi:hypothetical protein
MSGELGSTVSRAILVLALLIASPILATDRALPQDSQTVQKTLDGQRESLRKDLQNPSAGKVDPTGVALFKATEEFAGRACSSKDLERVVEKYRESINLLEAAPNAGMVAEACLQVGRFNLYLKNWHLSKVVYSSFRICQGRIT